MTMMKYFTPAWRDGELSDEEYEQTLRRYEERMTVIRNSLPVDLAVLVNSVSLHDAMIRSAVLDLDGTFRMLFRAGDLQSGYYDVALEYLGAGPIDGHPSRQGVLNAEDAEVVQDEVDVLDDGSYEHRFLFAPDGELRIRFRDLKLRVTPAPSRNA